MLVSPARQIAFRITLAQNIAQNATSSSGGSTLLKNHHTTSSSSLSCDRLIGQAAFLLACVGLGVSAFSVKQLCNSATSPPPPEMDTNY